MDIPKQQLKEIRDSRRYKDSFHYNWSILSGVTLTISINFIKDFQDLDLCTALLLRTALVFLTFSLILPLLRNFISAYLTGKSGFITKLTTQIKVLIILSNWFSFLSVLFYILGLGLLLKVFITVFL